MKHITWLATMALAVTFGLSNLASADHRGTRLGKFQICHLPGHGLNPGGGKFDGGDFVSPDDVDIDCEDAGGVQIQIGCKAAKGHHLTMLSTRGRAYFNHQCHGAPPVAQP